jgi:hypothetical protein
LAWRRESPAGWENEQVHAWAGDSIASEKIKKKNLNIIVIVSNLYGVAIDGDY